MEASNIFIRSKVHFHLQLYSDLLAYQKSSFATLLVNMPSKNEHFLSQPLPFLGEIGQWTSTPSIKSYVRFSPPYPRRLSTTIIDVIQLAVLQQIARTKYTEPPNIIFVPHRDSTKPPAAILATANPARMRIANGSTFAIAVEASTQNQVAKFLKDTFHNLPVCSNTPVDASSF